MRTIKVIIAIWLALGLPFTTTAQTAQTAQTALPENIVKEIEAQCTEYSEYSLQNLCIEQNSTAYISWNKFTTDPEFEQISEIVSSCSVDWPGYMMRVECVSLETKALMRMNNLVNLHGINKNDMVTAVQSCSDFQDMGYSVLETCIRQSLVDITGKPLP